MFSSYNNLQRRHHDKQDVQEIFYLYYHIRTALTNIAVTHAVPQNDSVVCLFLANSYGDYSGLVVNSGSFYYDLVF